MTAWLPDILGWHRAGPWLAFFVFCGYLIGSIPFGVIISHLFGLGDVRKIGSGNIGATNVLRTGNKLAAFLTLLLDGGKGAAVVFIAYYSYGELAAKTSALGAFAGHLYPIWLKFRGGKGVATFLGVMLALHWPAGILTCLTWLATAAVFRISSLAALVAALLTPIYLAFTGKEPVIWVALIMMVMICIKHWSNIARLVKGTEPKIGQSSGSQH